MENNKEMTGHIRTTDNPTGRKKGTKLRDDEQLVCDKVHEIAKLLAQGVSQKTIRYDYSRKWKCTEQNVQYFIRKAIKAMHTSIEKRAEHIIALQRERFEYILAQCVEKKDFATAHKIIDSMNRLYGLYTEKKSVTMDSAPTIKFDFGTLRKNNDEQTE